MLTTEPKVALDSHCAYQYANAPNNQKDKIMCQVFFIDDEADLRLAIEQTFELADIEATFFPMRNPPC